MRAIFYTASILFLFALIGCSKSERAQSKEKSETDKSAKVLEKSGEAPPDSAAPIPRAPAPAPPSLETDSDEGIISALSTSPIIGATVVSKRSLSLKVFLKNKDNAIFKPFRKGNETARHEVAFYRLARLLRVGRVPPSTLRRIPLALLEAHLARKSLELAQRLKDEVACDERGLVEGAMILWLDNIEDSGLDGQGNLLSALLAGEDRSHPLRDAAAAMVALDYTGGNWDRLSGGNLYRMKDQPVLALIDNNNSFAKWSQGQNARMDRLLARLSFIPAQIEERLAGLDASAIEAAMRCDDCRTPLLQKAEIDRVLQRRDALLTRINAQKPPGF